MTEAQLITRTKRGTYLGYDVRGRKRREFFHVPTTPNEARCDQLAVCVCDGATENMGIAFDPEFIRTLKK